MKDNRILRAIGNIDEDLIDRAAPTNYDGPKNKSDRVTLAPWLKRTTSVTAVLLIAVAITLPKLLKPSTDTLTDSESNSAAVPAPSLSLDSDIGSYACYADPQDWRGLPTENYILYEQSDIAADRMVFSTLEDLSAYADAFVLVPNIHETTQDGDNMQTSIAEYAETIGDMITTRTWYDHTISTGNRVLIRQKLIGGCTMDEPNNLLREGGVYLLPIAYNPDWGAYEVVGDLDALFELDDEGKIVSHSQWEGFNKYDGKSLPELLNAVRALYPTNDVEFTEQSIDTAEQAKNQAITAYTVSGFRKFSVEYDSETIIHGADVYLFKVALGEYASEYAAISKENGAFIRGELKSDGDMQVFGGLGGFP